VSTDVTAVSNARVARALAFIAENYHDPMLSVGVVAEAIGMSRRQLERSVRQETGSTVNEHIVRTRMSEASRLLRHHPRARSADIAALVGLTGPGTFFRTFRRFFGMSPGAHRDWAAQAAVTREPIAVPTPPAATPPAGASPTAA
jgi:AraC-like DNA-binding protein